MAGRLTSGRLVPPLTCLALTMLVVAAAPERDWARAPMNQQVKGCSITLFVGPNFTGPSWTTTNGWSVVGWEFNNQISSIMVHSGIWRFYNDDNFQKQIETLFPGHYAHLKPTVDNLISSFKCMRAT